MNEQKITWANYIVNIETRAVYYQDLDEDLYNQKYRGLLFCINGCKAKIKFTHRADGTKFFSTWNKDGALHNHDCPYHIDYESEVGRKKLVELYEEVPLSDGHIINTIRYKFKSLKPKLEVIDDNKKSTRQVNNTGSEDVGMYSDNGDISDGGNERVRLGTLDANHMTYDYVDLRKCVYGIIKHAYFGVSESGSNYLYLNLECKDINLSAYFPEAFYSKSNNNRVDFNTFYQNIKQRLDEGMNLLFAGVGFIKIKNSGSGLNVAILDKNHFMINETSYDVIMVKNHIEDFCYDY